MSWFRYVTTPIIKCLSLYLFVKPKEQRYCIIWPYSCLFTKVIVVSATTSQSIKLVQPAVIEKLKMIPGLEFVGLFLIKVSDSLYMYKLHVIIFMQKGY
jgi:hypothetical protein